MLGDVLVLVILAHAQPFSQSFSLFDFNQGDLVLSGEALDDLDVVGFIAVLGEDNPLGSELFVFSFNGLADFVDTLGKEGIVVSSLDNSLEGSFVIDDLELCGHCWW